MISLVRRGAASPSPVLLVAAAAAFAALIGHALQQAVGAFGGAGYAHVAQRPLAELAAACLSLAALAALVRLLAKARDRRGDADWLLPALSAVARLGVARAGALVAPLALGMFVAAEAYEQHAAGAARFDASAAFGSHVAVWLVAHAVIAVIVSLVLVFLARTVCAHVAGARRAALALLAIARPFAQPMPDRHLIVARPASPVRPRPLARRFANRPPPLAA